MKRLWAGLLQVVLRNFEAASSSSPAVEVNSLHSWDDYAEEEGEVLKGKGNNILSMMSSIQVQKQSVLLMNHGKDDDVLFLGLLHQEKETYWKKEIHAIDLKRETYQESL